MPSQLPNNITKYLSKYANNNWKIYGNARTINSVIVIPAIKEFDNIKILLSSLAKNDVEFFSSTFILFVVNNLQSSEQNVKEDNFATITFLRNIIDKKITQDNLSNEIIRSKLQIGLVDASSDGLELNKKEGGVGLARKIGMDEALKLCEYDTAAKKILICLDADCTVSENYISTIRQAFNKTSINAGYVNFTHAKTDDEENEKAIVNYEIFLRYYVLGLKYAKSPYAYHSIGSTMVCDVDSYVKIQGMNKRKAAEDFYFMEKLSKITKIQKIEGGTVYPSSRGSWRVPFGTGKRVTRFLEKAQNEYLLYAPVSFIVLKKWIEFFHSDDIHSPHEYLTQAEKISKSLCDFLIINKFKENWNNIIKNTKTSEQANKQKLIWFDGFKTLKLIHYLRDSEFPLLNMFDALDELFELMEIQFVHKNTKGEIPQLYIQEKYLNKLRDIV